MKQYVLIIFLLLNSVHCELRSQHADSARFNKHLAQYKVQFTSLMIERGMGVTNWSEYYGTVNSELLQLAVDRSAGINVIGDYSRMNYFEYRRERNTITVAKEYGLLLYIFLNDTLYSYLLRPLCPLVIGAVPLKADSLKEYERQLKSAISLSYSKSAMAYRGILPDADNNEFVLAATIKKLSNLLFTPQIRDSLNGIHYLEILPALNIASLPLYILQPFNNQSYLVDSMCIAVGSDPGTYIRLSQGMTTQFRESSMSTTGKFTPNNPLIIGNPTPGPCAKHFRSLPGAEAEADSVARIFGTIAIKGKAATKDTVRRLLGTSDFLYFAAHAYASPDSTMDESFLLLADHGSQCGKWTPREIQFDSTKPETIVILSACESGMGRSLDAGVMSVARGFIKAGAQNVVYSYWPVDDAATQKFMLGFMKQLQQPKRFFPAENLRQNILEFKKSNPDISQWGAFICMGVPYPVRMTLSLKAKGEN